MTKSRTNYDRTREPLLDKVVSDIYEMVNDVQAKVMSSPALNGGFDRLIHKMEKFEVMQDQVIVRVDQIHDAVYNPDLGLFARVKTAEASRDDDINEINSELQRIKMKQEHDTIDLKESTASEKALLMDVKNLQEDVKELKLLFRTIKWVGMTLAGAIIVTMVKFLYDFAMLHVKFM